MTDEQKTWLIAKNRMMDALTKLGFPEELGDQIVKNLVSPKAIDRMTSYLNNVKPKKANGLMQHIMKFFILGLRTCQMKMIK